MTLPTPQGGHLLFRYEGASEWLGESEHYAAILDNARAALNLHHVALSLYDAPAECYRTVLSLMSGSPATRMMRFVYDRASERNPSAWPRTLSTPVSIRVNPFVERVYLGKETVRASLGQFGKGVVARPVVWLASVLGGQGHLVAVPLKTRQLESGRVMGCLAFLQRRPFDPKQVRAAEAFANLAALSLENALLARTLAARVLDLEHSRVQTAQAEERLRREVAEMLHSRVQTRLLVAWHTLGTLEGALPEGHYRKLLEGVRRDLDDVRENDVREASHALHPGVISLGLLPAVRSLIARLGGPVSISLVADPALEHIELEEDRRLLIYRTLEEGLGNALRHAQARSVRVELRQEAGHLKLEVEDDGAGFALEGVRPGLGFELIESRVGVASGRWGVNSAPGQGTRLWAEFPLEHAFLLSAL